MLGLFSFNNKKEEAMKMLIKVLFYAVLVFELLLVMAMVRGLRPVGWFDAVLGIVALAVLWTFTYIKWPKK